MNSCERASERRTPGGVTSRHGPAGGTPHVFQFSARAPSPRTKHTILKVGSRQISELLQVQVNQKRKKGCVSVCVLVCVMMRYIYLHLCTICTGGARGQICTWRDISDRDKTAGDQINPSHDSTTNNNLHM